MKDPRSGRKIIDEVIFREEIYHGEYAKKMPDLIVKYNLKFTGGRDIQAPYLTDVPSKNFEYQSGNHDENGIFIAYGPAIKKGVELSNCNIQDMAPTILFYAMGLSIPGDMDGRVMLDIFQDAFVDSNPVQAKTVGMREMTRNYDMTEKEHDEMIKQLKGLGYF